MKNSLLWRTDDCLMQNSKCVLRDLISLRGRINVVCCSLIRGNLLHCSDSVGSYFSVGSK